MLEDPWGVLTLLFLSIAAFGAEIFLSMWIPIPVNMILQILIFEAVCSTLIVAVCDPSRRLGYIFGGGMALICGIMMFFGGTPIEEVLYFTFACTLPMWAIYRLRISLSRRRRSRRSR